VSGSRVVQLASAAFIIAVAVALVVRAPRSRTATAAAFTRVGRNGPIFTVAVPGSSAGDDRYLLSVAEQLSNEEIKAGASGQISVMIWPEGVTVPKDPPSTEFDPSMKTQIAGVFINPTLHIKHLIRFRDGDTVGEKEYGK
jgi:hypothetical protein